MYDIGTPAGSGYDLDLAARAHLFISPEDIIELAGWRTRGSATFRPRGAVDHHTAGSPRGDAPSLAICTYGRAGLAGPLCNVFGSRSNKLYIVAAGRANHAGTGGFRGLVGNSSVWGFEHENTGTGSEPWREDQRDFAARVLAALIFGTVGAEYVCEHFEWTTRKIDKFDTAGADMRRRVAHYLLHPPFLNPSPPPVPTPPPTPILSGRPTMTFVHITDASSLGISPDTWYWVRADGTAQPMSSYAQVEAIHRVKLAPGALVENGTIRPYPMTWGEFNGIQFVSGSTTVPAR